MNSDDEFLKGDSCHFDRYTMLKLNINDPISLSKICHALSSPLRLHILALLEKDTLSCLELSKRLGYPMSTISTNVKVLEESGLILTELVPAKNGSKKLCSLVYHDIFIQMVSNLAVPVDTHRYVKEIPVGGYFDCRVKPSCGYIWNTADDARFDDPNYFLEPERIKAQLVWLRAGFLEYRIPIHFKAHTEIKRIQFTMELCAEAPGFNNNWKSDITMWINGVEIGTWNCPGDFGDRKGLLTPSWWGIGSTQYGVLTKWQADESGCRINDFALSSVTVQDLKLKKNSFVTMRIGIKKNAAHIGGINIFGKEFGDYPVDIKMEVFYA